jgi:acetyl esterase/lipase
MPDRQQIAVIGSVSVLALLGSRLLFPTAWIRLKSNLQYLIFRSIVRFQKLRTVSRVRIYSHSPNHHTILTNKQSERPSVESKVLKATSTAQKGQEGKTSNFPPATVMRKQFDVKLSVALLAALGTQVKTRTHHYAPDLPILHIEPNTRAKRNITILYVHGGGFIEGNI